MNFHVGQKVVCIKDAPAAAVAAWGGNGAVIPRKGGVYTIRAINVWPERTLLRFHEIDNSHLGGLYGYTIEPGSPAHAFRPVKTTSIDNLLTVEAGPEIERDNFRRRVRESEKV